MDERTLWHEQVATSPPIERISKDTFDGWLATPEGAAIYDGFVRIALRLREQGFDHYGAQGIVEVLRFRSSLRDGPASTVKINNNYAAPMARKAMAEFPRLNRFFETRRSVVDVS